MVTWASFRKSKEWKAVSKTLTIEQKEKMNGSFSGCKEVLRDLTAKNIIPKIAGTEVYSV